MESYMPISFINDFIFCPRSIYFHQLYGSFQNQIYQEKPQIEGKAAHQTIDTAHYSTKSTILQGLEVYSQRYRLFGKIDIFEVETGHLRERKNKVKTIYDGYIYQVYAHCHSLREMGYTVNKMTIYALSSNKNYPVKLPEHDFDKQQSFEQTIFNINNYDIFNDTSEPNIEKCHNCIYSHLCDRCQC